MDSKILIFNALIIAIIFGNVYADQLKVDGGYNLNYNSTEAFKHTIDHFIPYRETSGFEQLKGILMHYHNHIYTYAAKGDTGVLGPQNFCEQYGPQDPASSISASINLDLTIGPPNVADRHYNVSYEQTSATTSTSEEIPMYTFLPTKEEEERSNKRKKI